MKQTAVEFLVQEINKLTGLTISIDEPCIEQAKAMEKEQIIMSYHEGWSNKHNEIIKSGEKYYNETFKSE